MVFDSNGLLTKGGMDTLIREESDTSEDLTDARAMLNKIWDVNVDMDLVKYRSDQAYRDEFKAREPKMYVDSSDFKGFTLKPGDF